MSPVGRCKSDVAATDCGGVAAGCGQTGSVNIDTQDPAVRHYLGDAHGDRCLTAAEVEHDHVRSQVGDKEVCVDSRAATRKRRLDLPSFPHLVQTKALRERAKE